MSPTPHKEKSSLKRWLAIAGILAAVFPCVPLMIAGTDRMMTIYKAPDILKEHEGQIATLQKNDQQRDEELKLIREDLKAIQDNQKDEKATLRRLENRLDNSLARATNFYFPN